MIENTAFITKAEAEANEWLRLTNSTRWIVTVDEGNYYSTTFPRTKAQAIKRGVELAKNLSDETAYEDYRTEYEATVTKVAIVFETERASEDLIEFLADGDPFGIVPVPKNWKFVVLEGDEPSPAAENLKYYFVGALHASWKR